MIDLLTGFSLSVFALASLSFLFVAYLAIKNDSSYKVNRLFSLAFLFAFFYFIFMGLYILPVFSFSDTETQLFAFLGLCFINLSIVAFAFVSQYIRHPSIQNNALLTIIIVFLIGVVASYINVVYINETMLLILGFTLLNISLTINSLRFIVVLFQVARKEQKDLFFKRKVNAYVVGFILFNILSGLGWALALFLPLSTELAPLHLEY